MIVANRISVSRKILDESFAKRIENVCKKILTLKINPEWLKNDTIISAIKKDKKQVDEHLRAVLMAQDLSLSVVTDITEKEIKDSVQYLIEILK